MLTKHVMTNLKKKQRQSALSASEIRWKVVYAEASKESERLLDDVVSRIYRFGIQQKLFVENADCTEAPKVMTVTAAMPEAVPALSY